ncbi:MAG TPA: YciI family protein [Candidatus Saccharimonadia bacterium]|nr:YciI family protein [Candidatus Saccharimonadia bacterium]
MIDSSANAEFLVISRGQWDKDLPPERIQTAIDQFYTWLERLVEEGKMKTGQRLSDQGATVAKSGITMDGPFGETKEVIGGYWFIMAKNLEEAAAIAAQNPCMQCGLYYEIRPTENAKANALVKMTETPQ